MTNESTDSSTVFDVQRIRELIELMREFDLNEIDLKHAPRRIRLRRGAEPVISALPVGGYASPAPAHPAASSTPPAAAAAEAPSNLQAIKSPMVGTFYSRPKPDKPSFVNVGDQVSAETIVCIVEAMKMFNEIPAGISGKIVEICVKDGEAVDVNKPLFMVSP